MGLRDMIKIYDHHHELIAEVCLVKGQLVFTGPHRGLAQSIIERLKRRRGFTTAEAYHALPEYLTGHVLALVADDSRKEFSDDE